MNKRVICLDIGGTTIKSGVFVDGKITDAIQTPTAADSLAGIKNAIMIAVNSHNGDSVAIASAGDINPYKGECIYATSNLKDYSGFKLSQFVFDNCGLKCTAINDAHAALLGEVKSCGLSEKVAMLTLGTGVGGAYFDGEKIVFGEDFRFGRWGHLTLFQDGKQCNCGKFGCIEQYISATALKQKTIKPLEQEFNNLQNNIVKEFIENLVLSAEKIYDVRPYSRLIIGGGVAASGYVWLEQARKLGGKNITLATLNNNAGMVGAYYWQRELYGK